MRKWNRPAAPPELTTRKEELTEKFVAECKKTGRTADCSWPAVTNPVSGEKETLPRMFSRITAAHCSYCDSLMGYTSPDTIDHFLPKSRPEYRHLAYEWSNLYHCCFSCNLAKGSRFDECALRPDEPGYEFSRYFRYHRDGKLSIIAAEGEDRRRAEATLALLKLHENERLIADRKREFGQRLKKREHLLLRPRPGTGPEAIRGFASLKVPDFEDQPYRDWYDQDREQC